MQHPAEEIRVAARDRLEGVARNDAAAFGQPRFGDSRARTLSDVGKVVVLAAQCDLGPSVQRPLRATVERRAERRRRKAAIGAVFKYAKARERTQQAFERWAVRSGGLRERRDVQRSVA